MKEKKVLFTYSRDIDINDSGAARTLILLIKYLSNNGYECHCLFNIEDGPQDNVVYHKKSSNEVEQVYDIVTANNIPIVLACEGRLYASKLSSALKNTSCKLVTALHSKPGYDRKRLYILLYESMRYNTSCIKRVRAALMLLFYPIFYVLYCIKDYRTFRSTYKNSDILVLLSDSFIKEFSHIYHVGTEKLRAICNPVSFDTYADIPVIKNKEKKILIVARFEERSKRLLTALKIWGLLQEEWQDWKLVIVGYGRSLPLYQDYIKNHNIQRVEFTGKQPPLDYYRAASLFMMTSAYEGWGMTIVESMQMGCVPVAMDSYSSLHEIIDDKVNGFIVPNDDVKQYASVLNDLMKNKELRIELGLNAVEKTHLWEPDKVCGKYKALFDEIINK